MDASFTYEYSQPDDYHFCQDSVLAPRLIALDLAQSPLPDDARALDVCCGCGVMGFELLYALGSGRVPRYFDFLDLQADFESHFKKNAALVNPGETQVNWISSNYSVLAEGVNRGRYDLVVANPPYFLPGEGSLGPSSLNNRARFFLDGSPGQLWRGLQNALKPGGRAYVLIKSGKKHGRDAFTSARIELFDCHVERLADVRGTDLIKIVKASS